jgi:hypothetical protein
LEEAKYKILVISDMRICWSQKVWTVEQAQLLAMFEEAGVNPEGLMARMALGGPVQYKANGFGITNVLDPEALKQWKK